MPTVIPAHSGAFKVLNHPDKEQILQWLSNGKSVREVEHELLKKYPSNKKRQISYMTLQNFRVNYLDLQGQVLEDIKEAQKQLIVEKQQGQVLTALNESPAYNKAKVNAIGSLVDIGSSITFLNDKIQAHIRLLEGQEINHKNSKVITDLLSQYRQFLNDYIKIVQKVEDKKEAGSASYDQGEIRQQINIIKEAVRETLAELAPDLIPVFMMKLKEKAVASKSNLF